MKLTVIGTGYLGATHAVAMVELGHEVLGLALGMLVVDLAIQVIRQFFVKLLVDLVSRQQRFNPEA